MIGPTPALLRTLPLLLLVAGTWGCTPARKKVEGDVVRSVSFRHEDAWRPYWLWKLWNQETDLQLRAVMEQEDTAFGLLLFPLNYFVDPKPYDPDALVRDAYRLEVWYAHRGFFDARVEGWAAHRVRPRRRDLAGVVDVVGQVDRGEPSFLREVEVVGATLATNTLVQTALRRSGVRPGSQFDLSAVYETEDDLVDLLANHGFPYARVAADVDVYPESHAVEVDYDVEQGVLAEYGEVEIAGEAKVPEWLIRQTLPFEEGERYTASELELARERLFAYGAFALVNVTADLSDPTRKQVPMRVEVTEAKFQAARVGAGAEFDGLLFIPRLSAKYTHVNVLHRLIRFEADAMGGYAYTLGPGGPAEPIGEVGASIQYPRLFGRPLSLAADVRAEKNLQVRQFSFARASGDLSLAWNITDDMVLRGGPHWEQYRVLNLGEGLGNAVNRLFGWDFSTGAFQLFTLGATYTIDWRDDPLAPHRGSYWEAGLREAFPLLGGDFTYTNAMAEMRLYRPLTLKNLEDAEKLPLTLAFRLRGELLHPWGDSKLPYPERVFLGGSNDLRGFRDGYVGGYDTICLPDSRGDVGVRHLPNGGAVGGLASTEIRWDALPQWGLSFAPFGDIGVLSDSVSALSFDEVRWDAGIGLRYDSVIGPIRIDLAFRPAAPEDRRPHRYVGCDPDDREARPFDLLSTFADREIAYGPIDRPIVQLFIAIGEAF